VQNATAGEGCGPSAAPAPGPARGAARAREFNCFALLGAGGGRNGSSGDGGNNGSTGVELLWSYAKAFPVPVTEAHITPGPAVLPVAPTALAGAVAGAICFDLDHPSYIRQVASPANRWQLLTT
jgi:hypothetical protein